jgi:hypothetical protein
MSAPVLARERPRTNDEVLLSRYQAVPLLEARKAGQTRVRTSIDLNLTMTIAELADRGVVLPDGRVMLWDFVQEIASSENGCFVITERMADKVQEYSGITGRVYSLYPTIGAPTMLVSGVPMHRIKNTNPYQDTLAKLRTIAPVMGDVLDTCTGLGYTACQASRSARNVTTVELDPAALEVARRNPWSRELFDSPKIAPMIGDTSELARAFDNEQFDCIIHDPPQLSLAGDLYSRDFYFHLRRVLKVGGKLFHYVGDPASKSGGSATRSALRRLQEVGFRDVTPRPEAFGLTAVK